MAAPEKPHRRAAEAERLRPHFQTAEEAAERIAQDGSLSARQRRAVVRAFRRVLLPPGPPGRRESEQVTRAYRDWRAGVRGIALFKAHIPRWTGLNYYARQFKAQRLMQAIRKRRHREKKKRDKY